MKRLLFAGLFAVALPAQAQYLPTQDISAGTPPVSASTDVTADSLSVDGACAIISGSACCVGTTGIQCGFPLTDILAGDMLVLGHSASPIGAGANLVGQDVIIAGGQGSMTLVVTQANCGAADTVTVTVDGTDKVCTRDAALDDATHFTCGASDAAMATNVAACLATAPGVGACAGAGCTLFTGVAGTAYVYRDSTEPGGADISVASSGNHAVAANGTDGVLVLKSGSDPGDSGVLRLSNADVISAEASPTGTDGTLTFDSREVWTMGGANAFDLGSGTLLFGDTLGQTYIGGATVGQIDLYSGGARIASAGAGLFGIPTFLAAGTCTTKTVDGATTFAATTSCHRLACTGPETINTITGAPDTGAYLVLINDDTDCTLADDDTATAGAALNLTGAATNDVGAVGKWMLFVFDGNAWQEVAESANN